MGCIVILTILILPVEEHSVSFYLFMWFAVSFIGILKFSEYRSFASLGKVITRYIILFDAVVNGIVTLISLSGFSLLLYRNASGFYILIL